MQSILGLEYLFYKLTGTVIFIINDINQFSANPLIHILISLIFNILRSRVSKSADRSNINT